MPERSVSILKKLFCLLTVLVLAMLCTAAGADIASAKPIDPSAPRNISIKPAGVNPWPTDGTSPTTGRDLDQLAEEHEEQLAEGYLGMAVTGVYDPIMVQHSGLSAGAETGAPFYGSYADVFYETAKSQTGHSRMCMIFNDFLPRFAGASRSTRIGYLSIRQEWNAPYFFQGRQLTAGGPTDVNAFISRLGLPDSGTGKEPWSQKVIFDGNSGFKEWLKYRYTVDKKLPRGNNVVWDLASAYSNFLGERSFEDHNHTFRFGDLPEGGDNAETVFVYFNTKGTKQKDGSYWYYFNMMYEYDEDENVYYRYSIEDLKQPQNNAHLFVEHNIEIEKATKSAQDGKKEGTVINNCTLSYGEPITFANIIIQYVDANWNAGGQCPNPTLLGTGNADYFMGGKHYAGVWDRQQINDRTVFYGPDGSEMPLQPGRTIIVIMDYKTRLGSNPTPRLVTYE